MTTSLRWEKEYFKNCYSIYEQGLNVGCLTETPFCREAKARLKNNMLNFSTSGIFIQRTLIKDSDEKIIGRITYNYLNSTAKISFDKKELKLKNFKFWNYKWEITDSNGTTIRYSGTASNGIIETTKDDKELVLMGLFAINLFSQSKMGVWLLIMAAMWVQYLVFIQ